MPESGAPHTQSINRADETRKPRATLKHATTYKGRITPTPVWRHRDLKYILCQKDDAGSVRKVPSTQGVIIHAFCLEPLALLAPEANPPLRLRVDSCSPNRSARHRLAASPAGRVHTHGQATAAQLQLSTAPSIKAHTRVGMCDHGPAVAQPPPASGVVLGVLSRRPRCPQSSSESDSESSTARILLIGFIVSASPSSYRTSAH